MFDDSKHHFETQKTDNFKGLCDLVDECLNVFICVADIKQRFNFKKTKKHAKYIHSTLYSNCFSG